MRAVLHVSKFRVTLSVKVNVVITYTFHVTGGRERGGGRLGRYLGLPGGGVVDAHRRRRDGAAARPARGAGRALRVSTHSVHVLTQYMYSLSTCTHSVPVLTQYMDSLSTHSTQHSTQGEAVETGGPHTPAPSTHHSLLPSCTARLLQRLLVHRLQSGCARVRSRGHEDAAAHLQGNRYPGNHVTTTQPPSSHAAHQTLRNLTTTKRLTTKQPVFQVWTQPDHGSCVSGLDPAGPWLMCFRSGPSRTMVHVFQVWTRPDHGSCVSGLDPAGPWLMCFRSGPSRTMVHVFQVWTRPDHGSCVSGLDPAGPWFESYEITTGMNPEVADYVDVIHTMCFRYFRSASL